MSITIGSKLPTVSLRRMTERGPQVVSTDELFAAKKAVLFGVPGAFTPACSDAHLPGFVLRSEEIQAKGVDLIACVAVNDVFVMHAWGRSREVGDQVLMLADGNAELARALGLDIDLAVAGLGVRNRRFVAILEDGVVRHLGVEEKGSEVTVSSAEAVLAAL
jgi:peroxiredoxin